MGSLRFDGVLFVAYSNDHDPRRVHGSSETEVIVDLRRDGSVALSGRGDAVRPGNARRADVKKVLHLAALHFEQLAALWEDIHGKA